MKEITVTTNDLMSVQDTAKELGRHRYQIYRWIDSGKVVAIKLGGVLFVPKSEVERIKSNQAVPIKE